jgi:hypothetical protein
MSAPIRVLSPRLERWCRDAATTDATTAVVKVGGTADPDVVAAALEELGFEISSVGAGSVTGSATPSTLGDIAEQAWVLSVDEPRQMRIPHPR